MKQLLRDVNGAVNRFALRAPWADADPASFNLGLEPRQFFGVRYDFDSKMSRAASVMHKSSVPHELLHSESRIGFPLKIGRNSRFVYRPTDERSAGSSTEVPPRSYDYRNRIAIIQLN
jgi:hypothetical protein